MIFFILQDIVYILLLVVLSLPLGFYIYRLMNGERVFLSTLFSGVEDFIYRMLGGGEDADMMPRKYLVSVLLFSFFGLLFVFLLQLLQGVLPFNPQKLGAVKADLAFNTAASFVTNTNWQAYSGEKTLSYLTQFLGLTVQNFVSAATGIAVLFVLIRSFVSKQTDTVGNFWKDLTRVTLYLLIPLSAVLAVFLVAEGAVQTFAPYKTVAALEAGKPVQIPLGPAASQISIKQLGSNGGGFFGANSAYPLENPTPVSNLLEMLAILLIPASLCVTFGKAVNDMRQGGTVYTAMAFLFLLSVAGAVASEYYLAPQYMGVLPSGSMEGKEVMHGVGTSSLWSVVTTASSNGSVNSMHDSLTPLGGMVAMFLMQLGEIVFGGVGCGLYGMIAFVILTVFIAGLMIGRTPEYLGKKIEPFDMKMVCVIVLVPPLATLIGTAAAVMMPECPSWLANNGPHGFSEVLYAFTSMANNNGSSFAGFNGNTVFTNVFGALIMLAARFAPLTAVIYLAGNLSLKKSVASGEGTLSTTNFMFVFLLLAVIMLVAALSFLPVLALGPIAEYLNGF